MMLSIRRDFLLTLTGAILLGLVAIGFLGMLLWAIDVQGSPSAHASPLASPTHNATSPTAQPSATGTPTATQTATSPPTRTPTRTRTATPTATLPAEQVLDVPVFVQELPLSCEFAGMRMVAGAFLDQAPAEDWLIACMPRDPNPYLGFRGDPAGYNHLGDGSINWDNYGAYAPAVAAALNNCVFGPAQKQFRAQAQKNVSYEEVAQAILEGYPVIVWVARPERAEITTIGTEENPVRLVFGEHVWVVVGYHEDGTFEVHDPYPQQSGQQTLRVRSFPSWDLFERMAVFVKPFVDDRELRR